MSSVCGFPWRFSVCQLLQNNLEKTRLTMKWFPVLLVLRMSLIPLLQRLIDSNWPQKTVRLKIFPSNGEITNFYNLKPLSSTRLGTV